MMPRGRDRRVHGADLAGDTDEAYGNRVFRRHYCVHLSGPPPPSRHPAFPADARAARGFNGDIGHPLDDGGRALDDGTVAATRWVSGARKTLVAAAGLVSVLNHTWTTDRARAVQRWSDLEADLAAQLGRLRAGPAAERHPDREEVGRALADDGIVSAILDRFGRLIGLWTDDPDDQ